MIEYRVLKEIETNPGHTQRTLAVNLGVSLGKVNYILGGLIEKGIVKAGRLKNEPGSIRWHYLLTPAGLREKVRMAKNYLQRRREEYESLGREIAELEQDVNRGDLSGESDQ